MTFQTRAPGLPYASFQNESSCETIQMKMSLICMKMDVQVKHIFIEILINGFARRFILKQRQKLGNGLIGRGNDVVFLGKTLNSCSASLNPGVQKVGDTICEKPELRAGTDKPILPLNVTGYRLMHAILFYRFCCCQLSL